MYLYHGTPADFDVPTLNKCKPHRDFGCGFYLATNYFDALPMAVKNSRVGYIQTYVINAYTKKCAGLKSQMRGNVMTLLTKPS